MLLTLTVTALALSTVSFPAAAAAEPGVDHAHVPSGQRFYTAQAGEPFAGYPAVFDAGVTRADGTRTQRIMLGYNSQQDLPTVQGTRVKESVDGGTTWGTFAYGDGAAQVANLFRLPNAAGDLVTIDFQDLSVTDATCTDLSVCRRQFDRRTLTATGWADAGTATVTFSQAIAWARFGQSPFVLGDGKTLLAAMYGIYNAGVTPFAVVVRSTDEGNTWTEVAQLATGVGWAEPHLSTTSDGGLLAVLRKDENLREGVAANIALYSRKAPTQSGAGWGAPVQLSSETGNSPTVKMMGNGTLVLASGRPDNILRFSFDGKGTTWSSPSTLYQNYPRTGGGADGWYDPPFNAVVRVLRHLGSSGTVGVMPIGGNRLLATGDNCASGWGCPNDSAVKDYNIDNVDALWKSWVEVDTDQWGKADLTTMFANGELTLVDSPLVRYGDCADVPDTCRQSLAAYAFDGDPKADSSLVTANRSVTVRLPRPMDVTGLGLHVYLQGGTDVRLETSLDGTSFSTPARGARDGIVRPLAAPVTAQYLRISDPNPVTDPTAAFLHELELYTTADGFEHDYPGQAPRGNGWVAGTLASVVNQTSVPMAQRVSSRFLRIKDDSASAIGRASWMHAASSAVTAEFRFRGYGATNKGMLFSLKGKNNGVAAVPFGFWLSSAGKLHWANYGLPAPWGAPLNGTSSINVNAWHTIRLVATTTSVAVWVDGALLATRPLSQAATTIDGFELGSNGTATLGDDWLFDDVRYTS
jgi:hypothetical protein